MTATLPLFAPADDPPDDAGFDFIRVETITSGSNVHDWTIRAHRHRNLFQILLIERGGGEMSYDATRLAFAAPAAILIPAAIAHGFRLEPNVTDGWVVSFTEDAANSQATSLVPGRSGRAIERLRALATQPLVPIADAVEQARLSALCKGLFDEQTFAREGYRLAMRGLVVLIAVGVARLAANRTRSGGVTLQPADATVAQLRSLLETHFRRERLLGFYAEKLGMTVDRLNDHIKRAAGVTAGHLIRQRVLGEAKRQLVFTTQPIHDIAAELGFTDPSHFARYFRRRAGTAPHEFREQYGG
jgi:AraC family transcriptional activator of pobA